MTDRIEAAGGAQDAAVRRALVVAGVAVWVLVALRGGGVDLGVLPPQDGATSFMGALVVAAVAAICAMWWTRRDRLDGPALLLLGALGGLSAWSLASIAWASAPDLALLSGNRVVLAAAVAAVAVLIAPHVSDAPEELAIAVAVGAAAIMVWALGTRVLPEILAPLVDQPRLAAPIGQANTLALIAVLAIPGALTLAGRPRMEPAAALIAGLAFLVLLMTGSRSGALSFVTALAVALWLLPNRKAMLTALGAGVLGAVLPAVLALSAESLTRDPLPDPGSRRGVGLLLGLLIAMGGVIAVVAIPLVTPAATRVARLLGTPRGGPIALAGVALVIVAGAVLSAFADRDSRSGVLRFFSSSDNNRREWWEQAWRGFTDAPLLGHGAGSFPLTHIAEREVANQALLTRQPHQIGLELLTEVGLVGLALALVALGAVAWGVRRNGRAIAPALCIVVAFAVHAQLDVPGNSAAILIPVAAAAGVVVASPSVRRARSSGVHIGVAGLSSVVLVACAAAGVAAWSAARADTFTTDGGTISGASAAVDRNPLAIGGLLQLARIYAAQADPAEARDAALRATNRQPENPSAWECLASISAGSERDEALARWTDLDPRRDPSAAPRCRP